MKLKLMRKQKGDSLRGLAVRAGMSYTYVCNLENGKADPSLSTLRRLAKALGVSLIELLADEAPTSASNKVNGKIQRSTNAKKGR